MTNRSDFENRIKQALALKADEAKSSDEILPKIVGRIEECERGNKNMIKDRLSHNMMKRGLAVSLSVVLAFGGVILAFSEEARAAALEAVNTLKTVFVLDKSEGEYILVEKSTADAIFAPIYSVTSWLSDAELTEKMGFNVYFPETLYGEYKYERKSEGVGIRKQVSEETWRRLEADMIKAIHDDAAFNNLNDYEPYRDVLATYRRKEGGTIFISMWASGVPVLTEETSTIVKTKVGNAKAAWIEEAYPDYALSVSENGAGKADLYTKPDRIIKTHSLTWQTNGVTYYLNTYRGQKLDMKEAVRIAESFMEGQK